MQRRNLFLELNRSRGGNPALPPSSRNCKPIFWNIRLEDSSGDILATLKHNRTSVTGLITHVDPLEELSVTNNGRGRKWQLQSSPSENATPLVTATHPKWWRRMLELETNDERFILCSKHRMGSQFAVHRVTQNLDAPGKRREREKEGELVGEIWLASMHKRTLKASFNEDLGLKFPLFCTWLLAAISLSQPTSQRHRGPPRKFPHDRHDSSPETSDDGCFEDSGCDGCFEDSGCDGGVEDSGSCGMDSGGDASVDCSI